MPGTPPLALKLTLCPDTDSRLALLVLIVMGLGAEHGSKPTAIAALLVC